MRQMTARTKRVLYFACCAILCSLALAGDDDDTPKNTDASGSPALNAEQQRAVNLKVAHPSPATAPERTPALGLVLDAASLLSDETDRVVADAEAHAAAAEASRLRDLYKAGVGTSLKLLEAAQAEEAKAHAGAQLAAARFAQHWGPVAKEPTAVRDRLVDGVTSGKSLLVRADLPGQHIVGALPSRALLDVDGVEVPGRVLGVLAQFSDSQSAGLLIEVARPPTGLAAGARVPLWLYGSERSGMLLPREAILYDENGAYVYKQLAAKSPAEKTRYVPVKVTLLMLHGDGWLVQGVDDDDDIVVHGAGVLWSLAGVGTHAADEDDED
jgi:hypothetical protein